MVKVNEYYGNVKICNITCGRSSMWILSKAYFTPIDRIVIIYYLGGMSVSASFAFSTFFRRYSIAAFRLNASINAVSCKVRVLPTLLTFIWTESYVFTIAHVGTNAFFVIINIYGFWNIIWVSHLLVNTSIPSVCIPTLSSGCSRMPRSIMSAICFKAGAKSFNLEE